MRFSAIFFSCKANARVQDTNLGHGKHSPPQCAKASPKRLTKVVYLRFVIEPVWSQNPDSQPTKVIPPITSLVPPNHQSLVSSVMDRSLTSNRWRKHTPPTLELSCLLQTPAMRLKEGMANRQEDVNLRPQLALWLGLTKKGCLLDSFVNNCGGVRFSGPRENGLFSCLFDSTAVGKRERRLVGTDSEESTYPHCCRPGRETGV
jgi:hypothetical protein